MSPKELDIFDEVGLGKILVRNDDGSEAMLFSDFNKINDAWDGAELAAKGKLANKEGVFESYLPELAREHQDI